MRVYEFVLLPKGALYIVIAAAAAVLTMFVISMFRQFQSGIRNRDRWKKAKARAQRGQAMIEQARKHGFVFSRNDSEYTVGICPYGLYRERYLQEKAFRKNLYEQEGGADNPIAVRALASRIVAHVHPTYTFWMKSKYETLMHTGGQRDFYKLMESIVFSATGIARKEVDAKDFDAACACLVQRTGKLFVPFTGTPLSTKLSCEHGYTSHAFDDAMRAALDEVARSHERIASGSKN